MARARAQADPPPDKPDTATDEPARYTEPREREDPDHRDAGQLHVDDVEVNG